MPDVVANNKSQLTVFSVIFRVKNDEDVSAEIIQQFKRIGTKDYIFQLEKASHYHYQCVISLHRAKRTRPHTLQKRLFALSNAREEVSGVGVKPASLNGIEALRSYCMKEDSFVNGPWTQRVIYRGQDVQMVETMPFPWQREVMSIIDGDPNDRSILWITNKSGNVGKTKLCKYLRFKNKITRIPMGTATQIKTACIINGAHRCYVVDFPRTLGKDEKIRDVMSAIEEIKNGWVQSAMYGKNAELIMMPPHVICFANWQPDLSMMSFDMWEFYSVNSKEGALVPHLFFNRS